MPRHSVRGPRPGSTDEDVSAIEKVHQTGEGAESSLEQASIENVRQSQPRRCSIVILVEGGY